MSPAAGLHAVDEAPLLEVRGLVKHFPIADGLLLKRVAATVKAVDGVSFAIRRGETLGLVGESGCGKSTTGRCILQLERPTAGEVRFDGIELTRLAPAALRGLRPRMQVIFQDPYTSLNPRHTVGSIVGAPLAVHNVVPKDKILPRVQEILEVVGLNPEHYNRYPNEFSGEIGRAHV